MAGIIYKSNEHKVMLPLLKESNEYIKAYMREAYKVSISDYQIAVLRLNRVVDCDKCGLLFFGTGPHVACCSRSCSSSISHYKRVGPNGYYKPSATAPSGQRHPY